MKESAITASAIGFALLAHGVLVAFMPAGKIQDKPVVEKITIQVKLSEDLIPPAESQPSPPVVVPKKAALRQLDENENQNHRVRPAARAMTEKVATPAALPQPSAEPAAAPERKPAPATVEKAVERLPREEVKVQPAKKLPGLPEYLAVVRAQVERNREYPAMARQMDLQGTVVVRIALREDGALSSVEIASSSGYASLDKAAISAVKRAVPFRSPGAFGLGRVTVEVPIIFRLT